MIFRIRKSIIYSIFIFFIGIAFVSCKSSFVTLKIENYNPAKEELPANIQSLTLLNRSMNSQFINHREDSLQMYFYRRGFQLSRIVLDSAAADTTIRALAALLFESGRYDVVVPVERNLKRTLSYEQIPDTLSSTEVNRICSTYNTDALLVLERFSEKVMADYTSEKYNDPTNGYYNSYYATLDVRYDAFFRIYKPEIPGLFKQIVVSDTIFWESADYSQEKLFNKLPSIKQALINGAIKIALDVDGKLSPNWIPERRGYFIIDKKNDRGQQMMNENNYAEAQIYWEELAKSKNKNDRSKAEFNLALISELNGDIDTAINWAVKSYYSNYRNQTDIYIKKLQERKEFLKKSK